MTEINKSMSHRAPKKEIIWCLSENNYSRLTSTTRWFEDPSLTLPWLTPPYSWLMLTENLRKWFLPYFGLGYLNSIGSVLPKTYLRFSLGQKSEIGPWTHLLHFTMNPATWQIPCELYFDPLIENSSLGRLLAPLIPLKKPTYCSNYLPVCKRGTWTWVHRAQMILSKLCMMWSDVYRLFVEFW